jgi:hypothetical protein
VASSTPIDAQTKAASKFAPASGYSAFLKNYFYLFMSLVIAGVVILGFGRTVDKNLLHPAEPRPLILSLHAILFSAWVLFYIFQSLLVRTRNVRLHRQLGWFGAALGVSLPLIGIPTAIIMTRFHIFTLHENAVSNEAFLIVPFFDVTAFAIPFALAIWWRNQPEFHRRLLLIGSLALTSAAFGRLPFPIVYDYVLIDFLVLLGVLRDLIVVRRIHPVYLYGLPTFALAQVAVLYTMLHSSPYWLKIAKSMVG